jgi:hypothetical protein
MSTGSVLALLVACLASFGYGLASVLQAKGAASADTTLGAVRTPAYLAGLGLDGVAWVLTLLALLALPIFTVQAIAASSLAVLVLLAHVMLRTPIRRMDFLAIAMFVVALVVLSAAAGPDGTNHTSDAFVLVIGLLALVAVVAGVFVTRWTGWLAQSIVATLSFSGLALCARSVETAHPLTLTHLLHEPLTYALVAYGITGMLVYTSALQMGAVAPITGVLWTGEVVVPTAVGIWWLGDSIRSGWAVPASVAIVAACLAIWMLASSPAADAVEVKSTS